MDDANYSLVVDLSFFDDEFLGGVTTYKPVLFEQISRTVFGVTSGATVPFLKWYITIVPNSGPSLP